MSHWNDFYGKHKKAIVPAKSLTNITVAVLLLWVLYCKSNKLEIFYSL